MPSIRFVTQKPPTTFIAPKTTAVRPTTVVKVSLAEASDAFTTLVGLTAVVFGAMNVVGGFWVTNRMLGMFRPPVKKVMKRER